MKSVRESTPPALRPSVRGTQQGGRERSSRSPLLRLQRLAGNHAVAAALSASRSEATSNASLQRETGLGELGEAAPPLGQPAARLLRNGSQGEDVRHAQDRLNAHGAAPPLATDAIFGPLTQRVTITYQNGHALSPDGIIGPKTAASLEGPTDVGGSSGQNRTPPTGPLPGTVIRYDTTIHTIAPPAPGTTMAVLNQQVQQKQTSQPPDLGPNVTVIGVTPKTQAEIFVWNVLVQLGEHSRWGTEADIVTEIGPAPTNPAGPAPIGRITLRIDNAGNAAATLIGLGPVAAVPAFPTRAAAVAALLALGFKAVVDASATWTVPELSKAHAAFSLLPADDRAALTGVDLVRERALSLHGGPVAGVFEHTASVAADSTTATRTASLKIADLAFAGDSLSFIGDTAAAGPASFMTLVHEAGHAVETKALRDAQFARFQAQGDLNGKIATQNAAITAFNASSQTAFAAARAYTRAQQGQAAAFLRTVNQMTTALQAMTTNNTVRFNATREGAVTRAQTARDAARAALTQAAATHPALTDFATAMTDQNTWFTAARDRAAANAIVEQRRADERAASAPAPGRGSRRLANFVAHVNANRIPPLTQYAADNWPAHPEEFFAEAYSLWLNDRAYLQTNAPTLVTFFDSGGHR